MHTAHCHALCALMHCVHSRTILHTPYRYDIPHGSCAVVCYFVGSKVFCAGLGDSRAVLCRGSKGSAKAALMADVLKPSDECERQRIQKLGGLVTENGRVAGVLGVSRVCSNSS
jgi:serine/threonine protein phosphatase PrpC